MFEEYTVEEHIVGLRGMLTKSLFCTFCPANLHKKLVGEAVGHYIYYNSKSEACQLCNKFVNISGGCPCHILGKDLAFKRTLLKLIEMGIEEI